MRAENGTKPFNPFRRQLSTTPGNSDHAADSDHHRESTAGTPRILERRLQIKAM